MIFDHRLVSSLEKCFCDEEVTLHPEFTAARALRGERFSFQLVWRGQAPGVNAKEVVFARVESPLADCVKLFENEFLEKRDTWPKGWAKSCGPIWPETRRSKAPETAREACFFLEKRACFDV